MKTFIKDLLTDIIWIILFVKYKVFKKDLLGLPQPMKNYAVEMEVIIDENTIVHRFAAQIPAKSKKHAREQMESRARLRVRLVINKNRVVKDDRPGLPETALKVHKNDN